MVAQYPMDVLGWPGGKLTLPINNAQEIIQPTLNNYASEWFYLNAAKDGVVFAVQSGPGDSTIGSKYRRAEWREMTPDGSARAAWDGRTGYHALEIEVSVDALPGTVKRHTVFCQIHDPDADISVGRIEGSKNDPNTATLWITKRSNSHGYKLTDHYQLGTRFRFGFVVRDGKIGYTYNGQPVDYTLPAEFGEAYFKFGNYVQTLEEGLASVTIYRVNLCHDEQRYGSLAAGRAADSVE